MISRENLNDRNILKFHTVCNYQLDVRFESLNYVHKDMIVIKELMTELARKKCHFTREIRETVLKFQDISVIPILREICSRIC